MADLPAGDSVKVDAIEPVSVHGDASAEDVTCAKVEMKEEVKADQDATPETAAKYVLAEGTPLSELNLQVGEMIEVLWEIEVDTEGEREPETVWWAATITEDTEAPKESGAARLRYVAQHGFEEETRRVRFLADGFLWDALDKAQLPYRKEGEVGPVLAGAEGQADIYDEVNGEDDGADSGEEGDMGVGETVKARFQGGERFCAGTIAEVHDDGTYDILYEDHVLEQNVPRDMIQRVALSSNVRAALANGAGDVVAESTAGFFDLFVQTLTSGPAFARLSAEQQRFASEKVRAMRPHFDAELNDLRDARGWGALVSGEDIKAMLPRVMARSKQAATAVQGSA